MEDCQRLALSREDMMADVDNRLMEVEEAVRHLVNFVILRYLPLSGDSPHASFMFYIMTEFVIE